MRGGDIARMKDWNILAEMSCPWCGRTLYSFNCEYECWNCRVMWMNGVMRTWKSLDPDNPDAALREDVTDVPEGKLVVRMERVSNV